MMGGAWRTTMGRALLLAGALFFSLVGQVHAGVIPGVALSWRDPPEVIAQAAALGATSARVDAPWDQIESSGGQYSLPPWLKRLVAEAKAHRVELLLILDYGHPQHGADKPSNDAEREAFGRYAAWLVGTLKGDVKYFQLWNEWEARTGRTTPGNARDYAALARVVMPMLRAANPDAIVLSNGTSYPALTTRWLDELLAEKVLKLFDGFAVHPYVFFRRTDWSPEAAIRLLDKVRDKVTAAGQDIPFYVTEFGFPDYDGPQGVAPEVVASFLTRFFLLADARPWIQGVWWYCLRDQGSQAAEREHSFGLLGADFRPKPAAQAFQQVARLATGAKRGSVRAEGRRYTWQAAGSATRATWSEDATLLPGSRRQPATAPKVEK